jgi:hypothetical protein
MTSNEITEYINDCFGDMNGDEQRKLLAEIAYQLAIGNESKQKAFPNPINVSTPEDTMIVDASMILSVGFYKCQNRANCNLPFHYMVELKNGRQIQVTLEKMEQILVQLGLQDVVKLPEKSKQSGVVEVQ